MRDVEPGEIVIVDGNGLRSIKPFTGSQRRFCVFEHIYFARPDSRSRASASTRRASASAPSWPSESPVPADVVVPVPDSGVPAAIGYAAESGIPFELGIIRNHYVGRTFIEPADHIRHLGVRLKHNANRALIEGKRVILVDDSIVRGTTSMKIVEMVRSAGATRGAHAHRRPPTTHSCFYGIDTPAARQAAGRALRRRRDGQVHRRRLAWPSSRSTASTAPWACPGRDPDAARVLRRLLHRRLSDRAATTCSGVEDRQLSLLAEAGLRSDA